MEATQIIRNPWNRRIAVITTATLLVFAGVIVDIALTSTSISPSTVVSIPNTTGTQPPPYPIGVTNKAEASGMGPPGAAAMPGYKMTYSTNFPGRKVPAGWIIYHGEPMSDPGAQFGSAHVAVRNGMLELNTWRDPHYQNRWVTGGLCQCGVAKRYGAYFVRSRITGGGASAVQLLWPQTNDWPPEVDFNETGGQIASTSATVHYGPTNAIYQSELSINMLAWHTWGVIWTPSSITYTVDGVVWATVSTRSAQIPDVPMHLALQQQTWCQEGRLCPAAPVSMLVNWVTEYQAN
ncbi:MAG TPA: glycoside hydrolase family 16 protein [Acidimicrobiales bacterium]|jgi:hypothetical protein|nr:glycoside hydrolase family 16 protein [Acidimicrobiales bacterium]